MAVQILKERYSSSVGAVKIGATKEEGGSRGVSYLVGGEAALPFQHYEGETPNRPLVAMEVNSMNPNWQAVLKEAIGNDLMSDPVAWAKNNKEVGADLIYLKLDSADPDNGGDSPEKLGQLVKDILAAVDLPLIVAGCGNDEIDAELLAKVAEVGQGENLLLGFAETENYQSLVAACLANGHAIIARSPLDINICKQLNILINEMNMPLDRIVIDPLISSVGYGIEYAYSIMERGRSGALQGDKMLSMPMICTVGFESWRSKEAWASEEEFPGWGEQATRGPAWEATTAIALVEAGADILCLRHPATVKAVKNHLDALMVK